MFPVPAEQHTSAAPTNHKASRHSLGLASHGTDADVATSGSASSASVGRWLSVKRMAVLYPDVVTEGALRNLIWHAEAYARNPGDHPKSNGFLPVISRPGGGRKILLDRIAFEHWLAAGRAEAL